MYFFPADAAADAAMDRVWLRLTGESVSAPAVLEVKGRRIEVPKAAMGIARFTFADLCDRPLGTLDFQQIAETFHTLMIDHIPRLTSDRRNEARRFINLIDTLYDKRIGLIASADCAPGELYAAGDGADHFTRTASRLIEMQSAAYLGARGTKFETQNPVTA
jgi:cell division protein ZapE